MSDEFSPETAKQVAKGLVPQLVKELHEKGAEALSASLGFGTSGGALSGAAR